MSRRRPMSVGAAGQSLWAVPPAQAVARRASLASGWRGSFSTTQTTLQTALSISGRAGMIQSLNLTGGPIRVRLTVDGHVLHHGGKDTASGRFAPDTHTLNNVHFLRFLAGGTGGWLQMSNPGRFLHLNFLSSVLLEVRSTDGSTVTLEWAIEGVPQ